jgi:hypothetical protein
VPADPSNVPSFTVTCQGWPPADRDPPDRSIQRAGESPKSATDSQLPPGKEPATLLNGEGADVRPREMMGFSQVDPDFATDQ